MDKLFRAFLSALFSLIFRRTENRSWKMGDSSWERHKAEGPRRRRAMTRQAKAEEKNVSIRRGRFGRGFGRLGLARQITKDSLGDYQRLSVQAA